MIADATRRGLYRLRVAYYDTDQARVVHHASYLRYLEVARVEFWRELGFHYDAFEKRTGLGLPVAELRVRYRRGARFDDVLDVETWTSKASRGSIWLDSLVRRGQECMVEGSVRLACVGLADGRLRRIPDEVLDACLGTGHGI
jgi:acyl-CoA thioester hydrolase